MSAIDSAVSGMKAAERQMDRAAANIARATLQNKEAAGPIDEVSLTEEAVSLLAARQSFLANTMSFRAVKELDQTTIDLLG